MTGVCRICGCTDSMACTGVDERGRPATCQWIDEGQELCSACVDVGAELGGAHLVGEPLELAGDQVEPPSPLLYDAGGRPLVMK